MSHRRSRHIAKYLLLGSPLILAGCAGDEIAQTVFGPASSITPAIPEQDAPPAPQISSIDYLRLAQTMRSEGDLRGAARFYRQAAMANPNDLSAVIGLGDTLSALGDTVGAAEAYGQAVALQPGNVDTLMGLGRSRIAMDQPEVAASQFQAVLDVNGQDVRALNGLGVAADLTGDHAAAQQYYRDGLQIDPENKALLSNLGLSLALAGDTDNAIFMLEELAAAPDASPVTRQNLALAYGLAGRTEEAERVAAMDLDEAAVRDNLAFIASHRGAGGSTAIAKALKVDLTAMQVADTPAVAAPQVSETSAEPAATGEAPDLDAIDPAAGTAVAEASVVADPPAVSAVPTTPVSAEPLAEATETQVAATAPSDEEPETAPADDGDALDTTIVARADAAASSTTPEPPASDIAPAAAAAVPAPVVMPAPTVAAAPSAMPDTAAAAPETAPAADAAIALAATASGAPTIVDSGHGRPIIAMPVAVFMATAPAAADGAETPATVGTTLSFYDAAPAAEYCKNTGLGSVNCLSSLATARGRPQSAMTFSAAFDFASK